MVPESVTPLPDAAYVPIPVALFDAGLKPGPVVLWIAMWRYRHGVAEIADGGDWFSMTDKEAAAMTGLGVRTLREYRPALEEAGWLETESLQGHGQANLYRVTIPSFSDADLAALLDGQ